jgi:hypothetical protein
MAAQQTRSGQRIVPKLGQSTDSTRTGIVHVHGQSTAVYSPQPRTGNDQSVDSPRLCPVPDHGNATASPCPRFVPGQSTVRPHRRLVSPQTGNGLDANCPQTISSGEHSTFADCALTVHGHRDRQKSSRLFALAGPSVPRASIIWLARAVNVVRPVALASTLTALASPTREGA